ncbi:MAG: hypothetical protein IKJ29_06220 [Akkermansia sp.]|nr:hypothetical protein [Akkermansia sp.]
MVYQTEEQVMEVQRRVVERRRLFKRVFTPEVLDALGEFLGVKDQIFAFQGDMDPYKACQLDAKAGVLRGIAWEVEHLGEAEAVLTAMLDEMKKG